MNVHAASRGPLSALITGAEGAIAQGLARTLAQAGDTVWTTTRRAGRVAQGRVHLDLADTPEQWNLPAQPFDVAFLCAAVTSQAQCGNDPDGTRRVNVTHTVELARRLAARGTFIVFISTNLVFDGETPHAGVDHPHRPATEYGAQKADAERALLALDAPVAIVRPGKVVVPDMPLFSRWIDALKTETPIHPFDNWVMSPVSLAFVTDVLHRVAARREAGIVHANASRDVTYAEAARIVAKQIGADTRWIQPVRGTPSEHVFAPRYATLDTTSLAAIGLDAPDPSRAFDVLCAPVH